MSELKRGTRVSSDSGKIGEVTLFDPFTRRVRVQHFDGEGCDPTDPMYPIYYEIYAASELTVLDDREDG